MNVHRKEGIRDCSDPIVRGEGWESLRREVIARAVRFSGNVVFDFRLMLSDPRCAQQAGRLLWQAIRDFEPHVLVGPGFGAAPLLYATAAAALEQGILVQTLMVRDKRKGYNQKKWVEGARQPEHSRAILIDDFMESGSALELVERALNSDAHLLKLVAIGVLFDMWQPLGSRQISVARMPVIALYKRHDIGLTRDCFDARPPSMKGRFPAFIEDKPLWWRFSFNGQHNYPLKSAPVIGGAVFAADDQSRVWCLEAYTGESRWCIHSLEQPQKGIVQKLQLADDSVVYGCYDGTLTRASARDGEIIWRWRIDSSIHATPEIDLVNQRLFVNTEQWNEGKPHGHLAALDWKTGQPLWRLQHAWWPPASPVYENESRIVVATCNDKSVVAVNADSGSMLWKTTTKGLVRGKPAIHQQRVLLACEEGWLQCLMLKTGELCWEARYGQGSMHQFLHIYKDTVLTLDAKWHCVAFDVVSGKIQWMTRLRSAGNWCPVAFGRYLVVLSKQGHVAVLDPQEECKVWEGTTGMVGNQPPAIGKIGEEWLMTVAANGQGLKTFKINPEYMQ